MPSNSFDITLLFDGHGGTWARIFRSAFETSADDVESLRLPDERQQRRAEQGRLRLVAGPGARRLVSRLGQTTTLVEADYDLSSPDRPDDITMIAPHDPLARAKLAHQAHAAGLYTWLLWSGPSAAAASGFRATARLQLLNWWGILNDDSCRLVADAPPVEAEAKAGVMPGERPDWEAEFAALVQMTRDVIAGVGTHHLRAALDEDVPSRAHIPDGWGQGATLIVWHLGLAQGGAEAILGAIPPDARCEPSHMRMTSRAESLEDEVMELAGSLEALSLTALNKAGLMAMPLLEAANPDGGAETFHRLGRLIGDVIFVRNVALGLVTRLTHDRT